MKIRLLSLLGLAGWALLPTTPLHAFPPFYQYTSKAEAMQAAKTEGKLILLVSGVSGCNDCTEVEQVAFYDPLVYPVISEALVYWNCQQEPPWTCKDYLTYTADIPNFPLPLVAIIDPNNPNRFIARHFGTMEAGAAANLLRTVLLAFATPVISNLTSNQLVPPGFKVQGGSQWASLSMSITGVRYRVGETGPWLRTPFTNGTWSTAPLADTGSNSTFIAYFETTISRPPSFVPATTTVPFSFGTPDPLNVTISPATNDIQIGSNATFTANASGGVGPYTYQWLFCSTNQPNSADPSQGANLTYTNLVVETNHIDGATNQAITISMVDTNNDVGYYRVLVSDRIGASTNSAPAVLTVFCETNNIKALGAGGEPAVAAVSAAQPKDLPQPNLTARAGSNVTFVVRSNTPPSLNYQWQHDGTNLLEDGHFSGVYTHKLVITGVSTNDAGAYRLLFGPLCKAFANQSIAMGTLTVTDDNTPPVLAITSHADLQRVNTDLIILRGTASDSGSNGVASVTVTNVTTSTGWATNNPASGTNVANWSFSVALVQGTNTISVAATDSLDNSTNEVIQIVLEVDTLAPDLSITSHIDLQTVATNRITLSGTASDAGRGDSGIKSVTVNGLPAANGNTNGSATANWSLVVNLSPGTNTIKVVATDNAPAHNSNTNVIHIISDTAGPTIAITSPTAGQRWSNAVFTVNGKATDNRGVTGVWCQTNGVWGSVTPASGWTNWNVAVSLVPGTNTVRAYSQDAAGNVSPTQTVSFVYVLSDRLVVQTNGSGTINPNYNGRTLEIGKSYTMTATAGQGSGFANWTEGLGGTVVTNKPTVRFVMQSNLVLVANFVDVTRPTISIFSPVTGQRVSNTVAQVIVRGRASDNVAVTNVLYQLNGGVWAAADTTTGWTNWTATLVPPAGTNVVKACAVDAAGNRSLTNWVSFFYVVPSPLTLVTNGVGGITRNFTGNLLEVGRSYTVTGVPGAGQVFSNWVGGVISSSPALSFLMQSNMVLQANFVPNPFIALQGSYNGLVCQVINQQQVFSSVTNSGFFALLLATNGGFSGRLVLQGVSLPFSGALNLQLQAQQVQVVRSRQPALTLNLQLNPVQDLETNVITGTVAVGAQYLADVLAYRAVTAGANPYGGAYTMLVDGCDDDGACFGTLTNVPWGDSPATVQINPVSGTIQMIGNLADGTAILQNTAASENGQWSLYASLYGGRGSLIGWVSLDTNQPTSLVYWLMPSSPPVSRFYTNGFVQMRTLSLARFTAPPRGQNAVAWTNAEVELRGGKLPSALINQVVLTNNSLRVISGSISNLNLTITPGTGWFSGSFVHPLTKQVTSFRGAVEQVPIAPNSLNGGGFFLGPDGSGGVIRLHPE